MMYEKLQDASILEMWWNSAHKLNINFGWLIEYPIKKKKVINWADDVLKMLRGYDFMLIKE